MTTVWSISGITHASGTVVDDGGRLRDTPRLDRTRLGIARRKWNKTASSAWVVALAKTVAHSPGNSWRVLRNRRP